MYYVGAGPGVSMKPPFDRPLTSLDKLLKTLKSVHQNHLPQDFIQQHTHFHFYYCNSLKLYSVFLSSYTRYTISSFRNMYRLHVLELMLEALQV